ncbi:P27 family phage terminase small subunit [Zavarzinia sp.]|uniref:P27 family phage terminase small subunit n=1 Tax=Zavarzinia sp. TaxID=2027920 RepID=UPI00356A9CA5
MKGRKGHLALVTGDASPSRCPGPPSNLNDHAKREWKRVAVILHRRRLLGVDMLATLEAYCIAVGMVRTCQDKLAAEGDFIACGPSGKTAPLFSAAGVDLGTGGTPEIKEHPANRLMLAAMREARLLAAELALTPHRRGKKGAEDDNDEDDLSDLGL